MPKLYKYTIHCKNVIVEITNVLVSTVAWVANYNLIGHLYNMNDQLNYYCMITYLYQLSCVVSQIRCTKKV